MVLSILLLILISISIWYYVFVYSKTHHRNVADEKGTTVEAAAIVKAFQTNETSANAAYLNKAVEIKGKFSEIKQDQSGNTTITIKSDDTFSNVFCTLKAGTSFQATKDSIVTIKGICTGFLSDVVINEAIVVK